MSKENGKPIYLKLGEKAQSFSDPMTKIIIRGKEVVKLSVIPKSKRINLAKAGGHLVVATEEEYNAYIETLTSEELTAKGIIEKTAEAATEALNKKEDDKETGGDGEGKRRNPATKAIIKKVEKLSEVEKVKFDTLIKLDAAALTEKFTAEGWDDEDLKELAELLEDETVSAEELTLELMKIDSQYTK